MARVVRGRADVGQRCHARVGAQGRRQRQRLRGKYIEPRCAQRAMVQRVQQVLLHHRGAPAAIDKNGAALHGGKQFGVDHAPRAVRQGQHGHHKVRLRQQRGQRRVDGLALQFRGLGGEVHRAAGVVHHRHAKPQCGAARHGLANAAKSEQAQRLAMHIAAKQVFSNVLRPPALAHQLRQLHQPAAGGHEEGKH